MEQFWAIKTLGSTEAQALKQLADKTLHAWNEASALPARRMIQASQKQKTAVTQGKSGAEKVQLLYSYTTGGHTCQVITLRDGWLFS